MTTAGKRDLSAARQRAHERDQARPARPSVTPLEAHPEVLARAQAALEALRGGETPEGPGLGPEELADFLRERP
jgi:hypothetical protein